MGVGGRVERVVEESLVEDRPAVRGTGKCNRTGKIGEASVGDKRTPVDPLSSSRHPPNLSAYPSKKIRARSSRRVRTPTFAQAFPTCSCTV